MLDIKLIREKTEDIRTNVARRNSEELLKKFDDLVSLDKKWRAEKKNIESKRKEKAATWPANIIRMPLL